MVDAKDNSNQMYSSIRDALQHVASTNGSLVKLGFVDTNQKYSSSLRDDLQRVANAKETHVKLDFVDAIRKESSLRDSLQHVVNAKENLVILTFVDKAYFKMFWNMRLSLQKINKHLTDIMLPICRDEFSFRKLKSMDVRCYFAGTKSNKTGLARYGTMQFNKETNAKIHWLLQCLQLGYNTLLTDGDIVYKKDPLLHLNCSDCDIIIQENIAKGELNSGFMFVRNMNASIRVFKKVAKLATDAKFSTHDQVYVNRILRPMLKRKTNRAPKIKVLDRTKFVTGQNFKKYWNRRSVVMIHNNFKIGLDPKIERFKKYGMWYE
ncbi:unnamed protein product [Owenia fusiformis]|uniref:Uncharacterized protein n=1 Tax=Owenia fusiformis TaxID=6347 RepID=A0A8J1XKL1_OWEFU|nr:unnamed protein product [Owenia fusiformis]